MLKPKWLIALYLLITFFGIVVKFKTTTEYWEILQAIDTATAIALALFAFFGYIEYFRSENSIKIFFDIEGKKVDTGLSLLRKNFTRNEVLGVLGMIQKDQEKRFRLSFFQDKKVLEKLQQIQTGKDREFVIKMSEKEAEQFLL